MSRRQIALLVLFVALLHGGVLLFFAKSRSLPSKQAVPRPEFVAKEARWVDEKTGEKLVYREFRVSTRLSEPEKPGRPVGRTGEAALPEVSLPRAPALPPADLKP